MSVLRQRIDGRTPFGRLRRRPGFLRDALALSGMRSHQRRKRERGTPMTDVQPEDVEAFDELKADVEYSTFEDFECGCRVSVVKDDSQGNDYPGAPSILFDYERCPVHSRDATDAGPIAAWIEAYSIAHPMKTAVVKTFTE